MTPPRTVPTTALTALLGEEWETLRAAHPTLPPARFAFSSAPPTPDHSHARWEGMDAIPIEIGRETLAEGALATITVVRHEAAHGLNMAAGVDDCSRKGVYHNKAFRAAGELVGLEWTKDGYDVRSGFGDMTLTRKSADAVDMKALQQAIDVVLPALAPPASRRVRSAERVLAECSCEPARKLRIAGSVLALGPVVCGICHKPFTATTTM